MEVVLPIKPEVVKSDPDPLFFKKLAVLALPISTYLVVFGANGFIESFAKNYGLVEKAVSASYFIFGLPILIASVIELSKFEKSENR